MSEQTLSSLSSSSSYSSQGIGCGAAPTENPQALQVDGTQGGRSELPTPPPQRHEGGVGNSTLQNQTEKASKSLGTVGAAPARKVVGRLRFQIRDQGILDTCYEQNFLMIDQIRRYFFKGLSARRARQRLKILVNHGLIRREYGMDSDRFVRLTSSGVKRAEQGRGILIPQRKKLDANTFHHDACVTAVRLRLNELWLGKWLPEALLKSESFPHIPDGVWIFPSGKQIAIEVENSPKGPDRFHKIQARWRNSSALLVLYVTTSNEMHRIVKSYLETGPQDLPFGLVTLDDLEAGKPPVWSVMGELDLFDREMH